MDTRTGDLYSPEQMETMRKRWDELLGPAATAEEAAFFRECELDPMPAQLARKLMPRVGRNEPCPCGSGHKFKKCCLRKL